MNCVDNSLKNIIHFVNWSQENIKFDSWTQGITSWISSVCRKNKAVKIVNQTRKKYREILQYITENIIKFAKYERELNIVKKYYKIRPLALEKKSYNSSIGYKVSRNSPVNCGKISWNSSAGHREKSRSFSVSLREKIVNRVDNVTGTSKTSRISSIGRGKISWNLSYNRCKRLRELSIGQKWKDLELRR